MRHMMSVDCGDRIRVLGISSPNQDARFGHLSPGREMASKVELVEVKIRREVAARKPALPF